ncbi:hypothetical protein CCACVL1_09481 [Corchorus capsularis]|uniref:Uncharacterized protein n=1 Tax=Corchorus capsularis TaxID=210143 RepID=A0A1R3IVY5_COCAP|nr:hypothetical protein CCACVL1_09481 [Corchorus capsularis]
MTMMSKTRRNTAQTAHRSSNEKGIDRIWQNAGAERRKETFSNACEIMLLIWWTKKATKRRVKATRTRTESTTKE